MRTTTLAGAVVALVVFGGLVLGGLVVGGIVSLPGDERPGGTTTPATSDRGRNTSLTVRWVSDTARPIGGNHHAVVAGRIDGSAMVFAPISGEGDSTQCALVAIHGRNGSVRWENRVPAANCTIHSVADPTLADVDSDGVEEVLAATTERALKAHHPLTGAVEFTYNLSSYGYTRPLVANVTGDSRPELVVVDVTGSVFVVRPDGTTVWQRRSSTYTWGQPALADFDGDGTSELVVALGSGDMYLYDAGDGTIRWNRSLDVNGSITWTTTGQADTDPAIEIVTATTKGDVLLFDGRTGTRQWRRDLGAFAAVHAFGDGDRDGEPEIYAVARNGTLYSLTAADGRTEWTSALTDSPVQMMPPPALGDVDGDGGPEVVAVTNEGRVAVVDPRSGDVVGAVRRNSSIWTHPTLADTDGDGIAEIYVMYGNGRVGALAYGTSSG